MRYQNFVMIMNVGLFGVVFGTSLSEKRKLSQVDEGYYHVVHRNETWKNANASCRLAGKDKNHETWHTLSEDRIPEVWVGGKVEYSPWLNITNCEMKYIKTEARGVSLSSFVDAVRECSVNCSYNFVLTSDFCYCSDQLNESYELASECRGNPCPRNEGFFCGENRRNNSYRCVCRYQPFVFNDSNRIGNCMTISVAESNETELQNEKCENVYSPVCGNLTITPKDWTHAGLQCFNNNEQFSGSNFFKTNNSSSKFWIAVFRRSVIHWNSPTDEAQVTHCVAASRNDSGYWLMHIRQCEDNLPYLCYVHEKSKTSIFTKEVILAISLGVAGTIQIILFAIIMYKYKLSKFCKYKRHRSFNIGVFHDKTPIMLYEEDPITPGVWTTGDEFGDMQSYHQICFGILE